MALGLPFGAWNTTTGQLRDAAKPADFRADEEFYPLTVKEASFITEDTFMTPLGAGLMAYERVVPGQEVAVPRCRGRLPQ